MRGILIDVVYILKFVGYLFSERKFLKALIAFPEQK